MYKRQRIYTGYIYDYEYTFKPMSIDSTNDSYIAESIALNAVAPTAVEDPEFSKEIGTIGYTTPELGLPETVTVDGEEHSVVWDVTIDDCEVYEDTLITGTIDDGSVVEGTICVYPDNMYYFVDCNDPDTSVFEGVKSISDTLVNTVNDQTSVNNGWGLSSAEGTYGNPTGAGVAAGNKYTTGWYAEKNQSIEYQFTLEPGRYSVTAGFGEFWPTNRARAMTVTVTNAAGETLGSADAALNAQADPQVLRDKVEIGFELTEQTVINISVSKANNQDPVLSWIGIAQALPQAITAQEGITASMSEAYEGETVTLSGNFAKNSLFVTDENGELSEVTYNEDGTASFTMPKKAVSVTGLVNTDTVTYVVPDTIERVRGGSETDNRNYFIAGNRALGMTFSIPAGTYESAKLHFTRQNSAPGQLTNLYDQTENESFVYENSDGYIAQYNGNTQTGLELGAVESNGVYKILLAYDSSVSSSASGNDYYVVGANSNGTVSPNQLPKNVSQLPYLELSVDAASIKYGIVSDGNIEITSSAAEGETVIFEEPENFVEKSLIISYKNGDKMEFVDAEKDGNTYSFTMPAAEVSVSCLVNTDTTIYVIPDAVRVNGPSQNDNRNYFVAYDRALGMTFDIPAGSYTEAKLNFVRENTAPPRTTNIYDQTAAEGFTYEDGEGYITQYDGRTQHGLALGTVPTAGIFKLLLAYDSSVDSGAAGNDYYVAGATAENKLPRNASELPYIELTVDTSAVTRISSVTADAQEYTEGSVIPNGAEITDITIEGAVEAGTTVYAALYSDGVLTAVSSALAVEGTSSMLNDTIKVPDSGNYELKVFAWNDNMVPQADAFTAAAGE